MTPRFVQSVFEGIEIIRTHNVSRETIPWIDDAVRKEVLVFLFIESIESGFFKFVRVGSGYCVSVDFE